VNRKILLLNLALLALAGALFWLLRTRWLEAEAHQRAIFARMAVGRPPLPPPPAVPPTPVRPSDYFDVVQKTLFSKDRNPTVVIEVPPPKPEPPVPPLPVYHGQMAIGDPVVFLSTPPSVDQKSYRPGEKVGPFDLVSFDREKITLQWNGKTLERKLADIAAKEPPPQQQQPAAAAAARPAVSLSGPAQTDLSEKKNPALGNDTGGGFRACVAGDATPAGTVLEGYKKVVSRGMFGEVCRWEQMK
jgi:hypothetical protein